MWRYNWNKKKEADYLKKLDVCSLKKWKYLETSRIGTIVWRNKFDGRESTVGVQSILSGGKKFLRIYYTQTYIDNGSKEHFDYKILLVTTKCYYGGSRYWFICPWYKNGKYCGRRVGVLYKGGDRFACRHCYELTYASKNENRRHFLFGLGQAFRMERKIEELEEVVVTPYYDGRPTKKYKKLIELRKRCLEIDFDAMTMDMEKKLHS
ncbi:MAG: hypothetical protein COV59_03805 [Candidatus Magasanikbacteria bacterium CG11_big_fil_rev_8_21_14_0_20_39_34]|uniref:Uncharacterized protein n=1 Tax=Candidatus Magasanikbacteria bacterium CG11_big_fil_rev_8_21_14_0_20_39_34 TaxID=1974653 RepID=A0A2H0N4G2_9BACT|nr:MAG: hypothetical protein COV59_03805 [Candidatus Magasanikbacteria bacterium CG11_big_fil_rev_8_21_14_0_20_39_34]